MKKLLLIFALLFVAILVTVSCTPESLNELSEEQNEQAIEKEKYIPPPVG